jgi:hypothetical protein
MRWGIVALIWIFLVGGMAWFMDRQRPPVPPLGADSRPSASPRAEPNGPLPGHADPEPGAPAGSPYTLELTLSFTAQPDPFGLEDGGRPGPALVLFLKGRPILKKMDAWPADHPLLVPIPGPWTGSTEFFFEAAPPVDEPDRPHAARLRLLEGSKVLAETTLWADPGEIVAGPFRVGSPARPEAGGQP